MLSHLSQPTRLCGSCCIGAKPFGFSAGEEDVPVPSVGPDGSFYCAEIRASGLPVGEGIPSEDDLFAGLNCQKGERQAPVPRSTHAVSAGQRRPSMQLWSSLLNACLVQASPARAPSCLMTSRRSTRWACSTRSTPASCPPARATSSRWAAGARLQIVGHRAAVTVSLLGACCRHECLGCLRSFARALLLWICNC